VATGAGKNAQISGGTRRNGFIVDLRDKSRTDG
jgi:hypothetical protein